MLAGVSEIDSGRRGEGSAGKQACGLLSTDSPHGFKPAGRLLARTSRFLVEMSREQIEERHVQAGALSSSDGYRVVTIQQIRASLAALDRSVSMSSMDSLLYCRQTRAPPSGTSMRYFGQKPIRAAGIVAGSGNLAQILIRQQAAAHAHCIIQHKLCGEMSTARGGAGRRRIHGTLELEAPLLGPDLEGLTAPAAIEWYVPMQLTDG